MKHRDSIYVARRVENPDEVDSETHKSNGEYWEEITVWNVLSVSPAYQFRGSNPTKVSFPESHRITPGVGGSKELDYVTSWVAKELWHDLDIDLQKDVYDIEVVEVEEDDDIQVI